MISLAQNLPAIAFSRNEIPLVVASDDYQAGVPAISVNKLVLSGALAATTIITFAWTAGSANILVANNPDDSGYQIPAGTGDAAHAQQIFDILSNNYLFDRDFIVTLDLSGPNPAILFTARVPGPDYDMIPFAGTATLTVVTAGVSKAKKPQFMHHIQLFIRNAADTAYLQIYDDNVGLDEPETGKTSIDIGEQMLHSYLSSDYPELYQAYARCNNSIRAYYAKYAQFYGTDPFVRKINTTAQSVITKGGLGVQAAAARNILSEICIAPGDKSTWRFLRQGSKNKLITKDQPEWLTWINLTNAVAAGVQLEVKIYNDDTTTYTFTTAAAFDAPAYSKWQFQCGFTQLGITGRQALDKLPTYYTCQLTSAAGYLSAPYAFVIDYRYLEWPRYFIYENSLGGFQTVCTTGKGQSEFDRTSQLAELASDMATTASNGSILEANISWQDKYTVNYGYRRASKRTLDLLRDFFSSGAVYLVDGGNLIPVSISTKNTQDAPDGTAVYASAFEYAPKYPEHVFTEAFGQPDESINELLNHSGSPVPNVPPSGSIIPAGGVIPVPYGDPHLTLVAGQQVYTAPLYLAGRSGYAVYSSQLGRVFFPDELSYNAGAGSFTILVDQFALVPGATILIWPVVLDPDSLFTPN